MIKLAGSSSSFLFFYTVSCSQRLSLILVFASYYYYFLLLLLVEGFFFGSSFLLLVSRDVFSLVFSFLGFCTRVLSALPAASIAGPPVRVHVWLSLRLQFVLCSRLVRVAGIQYALAIFFFGRGSSSPSRCHRRTASSVWRAAHCTVCIEGSRRSAVIGLCRPLWRPLASAAEGTYSFTSMSVCLDGKNIF